MKTEKLEKWLLLEQTGELSARQRRELAACPEAQAKRDELKALRMALPVLDAEPSPWTVTKIDAQLRKTSRMVWTVSRVWRPALALAACLTLVAGILNFHDEQQVSSTSATVVLAAAVEGVWNDPLEEDLGNLERLIVAASGDSLSIMEM